MFHARGPDRKCHAWVGWNGLWGFPSVHRPEVDLQDFLDRERRDSDFEGLTLRQQVNVLEQMSVFEKMLCCAGEGKECVGVCDIARDPTKGFDSQICVGGTRTLRTNCSHLWLLPSSGLKEIYGPHGRFLSREEKCRVCGIRPSSVASMPSAALEMALGNTILVPLIGTVLFPVLRAWISMERCRALSANT